MPCSLLIWTLFLALAGAGCNRPAAAPALPEPPKLRLPPTVRPTDYRARLRVDPAADRFSARIEIAVALAQPSTRVWLHAEGLRITQARVRTGTVTQTARVRPGGPGLVAIETEAPIPAGTAELHLRYEGDITRTDEHGLFSQEDGGRRYAITDFEPLYARRVFPCFDEPSFKTPWQLTLTVPPGNIVLGNGAAARVSKEADGWSTTELATTPPLPSYLVAFAVGPYELVDAGRGGQKGVPIRIAVPAGMSAAAAPAAQIVGELLTRLEQWFGLPYPFAKLDLVTIPLSSFAMENAAMITFARHLLLPPPGGPSLGFQRELASVLLHEMAHQWFGDMVTMSWWDDVWLNEAFATWLSDRLRAAWRPQWSRGVGAIDIRREAMAEDALTTARSVRQPIESNDDIFNAFDDITYKKGAAILAMFEAFLGPEPFRAGVTRYLSAHAWGNASTSDFVAAMSAASGRDLKSAWSGFLDRVGTPAVAIDVACGKTPQVDWRQSRWTALGQAAEVPRAWQIPFCLRAPGARQCAMLIAPAGSLAVASGSACPAWLLGNAGELGYYRTYYPRAWLARLYTARALTLPEEVGLIDDTRAMARAGQLALADELALFAPLAADARREVVERVIETVASTGETVATPELRARFAGWVRALLGRRARSLGWRPRAGEDEDTRLLRPKLLDVVVASGDDGALAAAARPLALAYLRDRGSVDPDLVDVVLSAAARDGDEALWHAYDAAAAAAHDRADREELLSALGAFTDARLIGDSLHLLETDQFEAREALAIWRRALDEPRTRDRAYDFMTAHFDALAKKLPPELVTQLVADDVSSSCDPGRRHASEAFFAPRVAAFPGGERELRQALERVDLCVAFRAQHLPGLAAMLSAGGTR